MTRNDKTFSGTCVRVKSEKHIDCKGVVSKRFKENTPGRKWMSGFLQRHLQLHHQSAKINKGSAWKSRSGNSK